MSSLIEYDIPMMVEHRRYSVDLKKLSSLLREHKSYTNRQIAELTDRPLTLVEHWFRTDRYQAIPSPSEWAKLKDILSIEDSSLDVAINTFDWVDGKFDMRERVYDCKGCAPTVTADGEIKVLVYD